MYPADFEADTSHLTLEEDGAYNRLLRLCWMTPGCSLPDDPAWIARRMRLTPADFSRVVAPLLDEFFKRKNGRVFSTRLTREWEKVDETSRKRSEAGKKGGRPKAVENTQKDIKPGFDFDKAGPKQPEPYPEPDIEIGKPISPTAKNSPPEPKARLPADWALSDAGWAYARSQKIPDEVIVDEARGFHAYWSDRRDRDASKSARGWEATWENRCRAISGRYQSRGGMAGQAAPYGYGQGGSIASIAARRRATGQV